MAAVTTAVVSAGATLYGASQQSSAARDAARTQARGVAEAQRQQELGAARGREFLLTGQPIQSQLPQYSPEVQNRIDQIQGQLSSLQSPAMANFSGRSIQTGRAGSPEAIQALQSELQSLQSQALPAQPQQQYGYGDPLQNYLAGIGAQAGFTGQGYQQAEQTLNPLAAMAQPYLGEQSALLGMSGPQAYQQALSRISDPLAAEQERAFMRNNAALGGVGGNVLSALAEQTRARTEANIGNRLGQLAGASSPALNALQQISNQRLNLGLQMGDIFGGAGMNLAQMEENRRRALANLEIGQGSQMAQLAQNYGTAAAGGSAYAAQNAPALSQGLVSGLRGYMRAGGIQNRWDQYQTNRQSGYGNIGDPFA